MSRNYNQQSFGQPSYTNGPVSASSSGPDHFDMLDAPDLYHNHNGRTQRLQPLRIPSQDGFRQDQHIGYATLSDSLPIAGKRKGRF